MSVIVPIYSCHLMVRCAPLKRVRSSENFSMMTWSSLSMLRLILFPLAAGKVFFFHMWKSSQTRRSRSDSVFLSVLSKIICTLLSSSSDPFFPLSRSYFLSHFCQQRHNLKKYLNSLGCFSEFVCIYNVLENSNFGKHYIY